MIILCYSIFVDFLILPENLWLSVAKMDVSFYFMWWSLTYKCLVIAGFSSSAFSQLENIRNINETKLWNRKIPQLLSKYYCWLNNIAGLTPPPPPHMPMFVDTILMCTKRLIYKSLKQFVLTRVEWYTFMPTSFKILLLFCLPAHPSPPPPKNMIDSSLQLNDVCNGL